MRAWVCGFGGWGGCLLLLAITFFAVVAVTDVYASVTALRGGGIPGTMIISSQEQTLPIDFFCFAEGRFVPDSGGPVVDVALEGWCGEPGTEVTVRYVPSLREHLPLFLVGVERGTWAELATVTLGGSIVVGGLLWRGGPLQGSCWIRVCQRSATELFG